MSLRYTITVLYNRLCFILNADRAEKPEIDRRMKVVGLVESNLGRSHFQLSLSPQHINTAIGGHLMEISVPGTRVK